MPQEIHPSSYICDCGYRCEFSRGTVSEVRAASLRRKQALIADDGEHEVIFDHGVMIGLYCPLKEARKDKKRKRRSA